VTEAAAEKPPVITLVNPLTGVRFEYSGRWLRNGSANDTDVRMGRARFKGDRVYLQLPPGVQKQLDAGRLQFASAYDEQTAFLADAPGPSADPGSHGWPGGVPMPDGRAAHDVWVQYAVSQGVPQAEADGMTRDQLRVVFAGPRPRLGGTPDLEVLDEDPGTRAARRR
jgi:hypothetical protein